MGQRPQQGVRSVEIGLALVQQLAAAGRDLSLKDLARAANLAPAKAHRYLVSLGRARLVARGGEAGSYGLGPLAVNLGLSALGRMDGQRLAWEQLAALRDATGQTVVQAIWGDGAAVVARVEQPARAITVTVRTGAALPVLSAASGRVFAAFLPPEIVAPIVEREFAAAVAPTHMGRRLDRRSYQALLSDIRARGLARSEGDMHDGIGAISAPVFDHGGQIAMVFAVVGTLGTFDLDPKGKNVRALRDACSGLSERLGFRTPAANDGRRHKRKLGGEK
jgi:DNA-binding IclR family transcriptional regulator